MPFWPARQYWQALQHGTLHKTARVAHLTEVHEGGGAPLLLLLAVDVLHGDVDVVQQLRMVLHRVARREEDHHLRTATLPGSLLQASYELALLHKPARASLHAPLTQRLLLALHPPRTCSPTILYCCCCLMCKGSHSSSLLNPAYVCASTRLVPYGHKS